MLHIIAQQASGDDALVGVLSGLGSGGAVGFVLWRILERREARWATESDAKDARIRELTDRLFVLADTSTKVAHGAAEVVREDAAAVVPDPRVGVELARISAQLQALTEGRNR